MSEEIPVGGAVPDEIEAPMTAEDEALLARLRLVAVQVDPVPELVEESARAAFAMRRIDAELAELVADSATDPAAVAMRGTTDEIRMITFSAESVSFEIQVTPSGGQLSILGLVSGATGPIEVETPTGHVTEVLDDLGRFWVSELDAGPVRFRVTPESGHAVTTTWVNL
jgi:hypothetical protein